MIGLTCPRCVEIDPHKQVPVADIEALVSEREGESLGSFVEGRDEVVKFEEVLGWRLVPCGHDYPVGEWLVLVDEAGIRLHPRRRVMLIADDGEVIPA